MVGESVNLECMVIPLIMQPFVENAIVHGFEKADGEYALSIVGTKVEKYMTFQIKDTGVGMSHEQMEAIWEKADAGKYASQRIGRYAIRNVKERLELIYPGHYEWIKGVSENGQVYSSILTIQTNKSL